MALCAGGSAPNITAFHFRESVASVSGQCGVPQWPDTTRLSRGFGGQRGHVSPPVAALGGNGTSPLDPVRCSVVSASGQCGVPQCPATTRLSLVVRNICSPRPLRPPASLLHNAALPSVPGSRCAKAPLGAGHRCAPFTSTSDMARLEDRGKGFRCEFGPSHIESHYGYIPRPLGRYLSSVLESTVSAGHCKTKTSREACAA
jgi:hypothetical protein